MWLCNPWLSGAHSSDDKISGLREANRKDAMYSMPDSSKRRHVLYCRRCVLNVVAMAPTLEEAREKALSGVKKIHWDGAQYRTDIAVKDFGILKNKKFLLSLDI